MGIKNTAMKFFMADEAEERGYEAPHLVKSCKVVPLESKSFSYQSIVQ